MRQHARLILHDGLWYFQIDNVEGSTRTWVDRKTALAALADQGWEVCGQYPKHFAMNLRSRLGIIGYSLLRIIH